MSSAAVAIAIGLASPALAQDETVNAASPPTTAAPANSSDDAVGPAQLRDFSLNGTVTRRADTPATAAPQPAAGPTTTASAPATAQPTAPGGQTAASRPERAAAGPAQRQASGTASGSAAGAFSFTPSAPANNQPTAFAPGTLTQPAATPIVDTVADTETNPFSYWPWLLALLAAAGAAIWYFRRQRSGYAFAGAGAEASTFDLSPPPAPSAPPKTASPRAAPVPQQVPRAPAPAPAPSPPPPAAPQGIVSTRLRPWLEIEFHPEAAIIDADKGSIQFEVTVFNSGSAPARDVLVEAAMFNAGADQDQVIGNFFTRPVGQEGDGVVIPPLQRLAFRSIVNLPRDQLRLFEVERRALFVPLVGFNVRYRWTSGQGQTSASYIVGRNTAGEKMAPFRVDQGAKTFRGLAAREHTLRVRK